MWQRLVQLSLDLFEPSPELALVVPAPVPPVKSATPNHSDAVQDPAALLSDVLALPTYRHPQANRELSLGAARVAFLFKRGRRRTIGFVVGPLGLAVSAPQWVRLQEVDEAVREKSDWILRKLGDAQQRHQHQQATQIDWCDGALVPFLGEMLCVVLDSGQDLGPGGAQLQTLPGVPAGVSARLVLGLAQGASPTQIRDAVQAWLMRQAKRLFTDRLNYFAPQLGVQWRKLALSSAGTRWGSANVDGSIRLNWRLIHCKLPVIDYVVAHELSHLRVMNHSRQFWDTVATVMPDYAQRRAQLRQQTVPAI